MAAPTNVETPLSEKKGNTTSLTVVAQSGGQVGDTILLYVIARKKEPVPTVTTPSGFTLVAASGVVGGANTIEERRAYLFTKVKTEPGSEAIVIKTSAEA